MASQGSATTATMPSYANGAARMGNDRDGDDLEPVQQPSQNYVREGDDTVAESGTCGKNSTS